jgi:hypothetical protein
MTIFYNIKFTAINNITKSTQKIQNFTVAQTCTEIYQMDSLDNNCNFNYIQI